ncbi:beta strand repeat-containing protein [Burkholderia cenocepacia]
MNHLPYPAMRNPLRARLRLIAAAVATAVLSFSGEASAQYVNVNSGGSAAQASGTDSIAVGAAATAAGSDSTAIGTNARVYPTADTGSMAIGYGAKVAPGGANSSAGNLAIGMNAAVGGNTAGEVLNAIAIGTSASSERSGGISIGASSHNAGAAIAIGNGANTGVDGQIAIGNRALADPSSIGANGGVAIGQDSYTSGVGSALGVNAHASGNSVAAGANSFAGWRDTVIGVQASATGNTSVAIGFQSNDGGRDQVVSVGANGFTRAVVNVTAGTTTTDAANVGQLPGTIAGNVVTMGNTLAPGASLAPATVTNVAAGKLLGASTDAVNGSQLFATNMTVTSNKQMLDNLAGRVVNGTIGLVQQQAGAPGSGAITVGSQTGGTSVDFTGTDGPRTLSGVAAGSATTDAVNVGQLNAVASAASNAVQYDNTSHTSVTLGATSPAAAPVALSNVAAGALSAASTDAINGGQLFATNQAVTNTSTAITNLSNGIAAGTVGLVQQTGGAPGTGPIMVGAQTGGRSVDFTGTDGPRTLSGVAAGAAATDAVNVGQLTSVAGVAANAVQYDNAGHTSVTLGGAAAAAPVALTNVAAGTLSASSVDAVNGGQLFATNQAVASTSTAVTNLSSGVNAGTVGLVQQAGGAPGSGSITVGAQTSGTSVDFTGTAGARTLSGVAAGTAATDAVNVGQLTAVAGVAANAVQYDNAGHTSVTLGGAAAAAPVVLTNVAAGALSASSVDAVNGGQLFTTNQAVANTSTAVTNLSNGIAAGTVGLVQQTGGAPGTGPITVGAQTGGTSVDFTGTDGARKLSGVAAGAAATDAVNVGQLNAVAGVATNAVQYDNASHTSVTLGGAAVAAPVVLTNVAAGKLSASSTDAINGGQLFATNQAVTNTSIAVTNLSNGINAGTVGLVQQAGGAPGSGPIIVGAQTGGTSVDFTGTDGPRTLSGVAAGAAATDAVNVGQLTSVAGVAANAVQYDNAGHTSVTLGGAAAAAPVALTNVAAGTLSASSVDAVNGGQLFATNQAVASTSTAVTNLSNGVNAGTVGLVQQAGGAPGSGSITVGAQTSGTSVDFTGTAGARTLSGVAAGTAATDAVNVGQLTAVAGVAANAVQYDNAGHTSVTLGGAAAAAPVVLTNVAAGTLSASSVDAVNGGQLFTTNQAVANTSTAVTNLSNGIAAGTVGLVQQTGGAPGTGPITVGAQTGGTSVDFTGTDGTRKLSGVAAGTAATDAVNVGQLNAVAGVATNAVQYDNAGHTSVTLGGASAAAPVALTNVAAGTLSASSTDAVNGAQLYATNQALSGTTSTVNALSMGIAAGTIGLVQQAGGAPGTGVITIGAKTGGSAIDVSGTSGARQLKGVAAGTDATDAVNVSQLNATVSSATANAVVYDSAARSIVTLGGLGASAPVTLRNVAAGVLSGTSTDAVNGSQLYTTNLAVAANTGAIDALTNSLTDVQRSMARNTAQLQPIVSADALKYFAASSTGAPASASGTETVAAGGNSLAAGANSVAIGTGAQAIGSGALALGANTSAKGSNSIALGQGSAASADNTVSIGNSATGLTRTLTNVSAGVAPTDAVNVRQLSDAVGGLRSQIEHDRADANGGSASAVAIASLPQAPAPGHSVVSIGGGTYAGQSAVAVGMSTYAGRWILKASGSTNTRGTVAAGAGAAYVW